MKLNKKAAWGSFEIFIAVILIGVVLLNYGDEIKAMTGIGTPSAVTPTTGGAAVSACNLCSDASPTVTIGPMYAKGNTTNELTAEWVGVVTDGVYQGLKQDASTIETACGSKLDLYYGLNSSNYYTNSVKGLEVTCGDFSTASKDSNSNILFPGEMSTTFTMNFYNKEDGNLNNAGAGGSNESISTGESTYFTYKFSGARDRALSPGGDSVMTIEVNGTDFDSTKIEVDGLSKTSLPVVFQSRAGTFDAVAYKLPSCPTGTATYCDLTGTLFVTAKSSVDPSAPNEAGCAGGINVTIWPGDYYIDTDVPNLIAFGVEDNDGARPSTYFGANQAPISKTICYS